MRGTGAGGGPPAGSPSPSRDRGFGRTELARTCHDLRLRYVIRIKPDVRVAHPSYTGRLDDYPIRKGMWRVLTDAEYRSDKAVRLNVVIRWK